MTAPTCTKCHRPPNGRYLARGLCDACYFTHRTRQIAYGRWQTMFVDPTPTRDHINAFRELGIGFRRIAELADMKREVIRGIAVGRSGRPPVTRVHSRTEARILAVPLPTIRESYRIASAGAGVPVIGTRRRARALMRNGYTQTYICSLISASKFGHTKLWADGIDRTTAGIAARVADIFEELEHIPGPSDRARRWAEKNGWPPPLAWDEDTIDDPAAVPYRPTEIRPTAGERITELRELGVHDINLIAERLGIQPKSVERQLYRSIEQEQVAS